MNSYAAGTAVTVTIPLEDLNGDALTPTALSWRLVNENEVEVKAPTALAVDPAATEVIILINQSYNMLVDMQASALREIELSVTTAAGVILLRAAYLVAAPVGINVLKNSFQTYGQARLLATQIPNLLGWETSDENLQRTAMAEAFVRLTRLGYRIKEYTGDALWQSKIDPTYDTRISPRAWSMIARSDWDDLPLPFRTAMARAQLIEANEILSGNVIEDRREAGLLSESIGESSMMFRSGKPLQMGVSARALREVEGYVDIRMTTTRA